MPSTPFVGCSTIEIFTGWVNQGTSNTPTNILHANSGWVTAPIVTNNELQLSSWRFNTVPIIPEGSTITGVNLRYNLRSFNEGSSDTDPFLVNINISDGFPGQPGVTTQIGQQQGGSGPGSVNPLTSYANDPLNTSLQISDLNLTPSNYNTIRIGFKISQGTSPNSNLYLESTSSPFYGGPQVDPSLSISYTEPPVPPKQRIVINKGKLKLGQRNELSTEYKAASGTESSTEFSNFGSGPDNFIYPLDNSNAVVDSSIADFVEFNLPYMNQNTLQPDGSYFSMPPRPYIGLTGLTENVTIPSDAIINSVTLKYTAFCDESSFVFGYKRFTFQFFGNGQSFFRHGSRLVGNIATNPVTNTLEDTFTSPLFNHTFLTDPNFKIRIFFVDDVDIVDDLGESSLNDDPINLSPPFESLGVYWSYDYIGRILTPNDNDIPKLKINYSFASTPGRVRLLS